MSRMMFRIVGCCVVLISTVLCHVACAEEGKDYYLEASATKADALVTVNGFPFPLSSSGSRSTSTIITHYLKGGNNDIGMQYAPRDGKGPLSDFSVRVMVKDRNVAGATKTAILAKQVETLELSVAEMGGDITPLVGRIGTSGFPLHFGRSGNIVTWAAARKPKGFGGRLTKLAYVGLTQNLKGAEVHVIASGRPFRLVYGGLDLAAGTGVVELNAGTLTSGGVWREQGDWDTILVRATATEPGEVEMQSLKITAVPELRDVVAHVQVETPCKWAWEQADPLETLSQADEDAIWQLVSELHDAVAGGKLSVIRDSLRVKTRDMAAVTGSTEQQLETGQASLFSELARRKDWKLVPIERSSLRCWLVNKTVVKVESLSGNLISSEPMKDTAGRGNIFSIPLYVSRIGGKWVIVD